MIRRLLAAVAAFAIVGLPPLDPARGVPVSSAVGADVVGDDERDVYVGTGGLVLPGSVDRSTRQQVAGCADCAWRLTTPCVESSAGHPFDSAGPAPCSSVVRGCPGGRLLRSWFRDGGPWRETGLVCLSDASPVTVRDLGAAAAQRVEEAVPGLDLRVDPGRGALTQLPVIVRSGQPAGIEWTVTLLGRAVDLRARARWRWDFGDGARLTTSDPGAAFPRGRVAHTYRVAGVYRVVCTADWEATFTVDGLGPFPVPGPIRQGGQASLPVGEGRALLVPEGMAH